ncbi:MAG: SIMPL domain-containing protein [Bacteroidia bacterium]|nr:SIMPL domain-containing protein [Bacteroidia bacterium]
MIRRISASMLLLLPALSLLSQAGGNALFKARQTEYDQMPMQQNAAFRPQGGEYLPQVQFAEEDQVEIEVRALMNVRADAQVAVFHVRQLAETAAQANSLMQERIGGLMQALAQLGIPREAVFVDVVSQVPIFETEVTKKLFSKTYNEVPKGFELQKNLHIRFSKSEQIDVILKAAADQEIYDLITVDYFVEDSRARYDSLREAALDVLKTKVERLGGTGLRVDSLFTVAGESVQAYLPSQRYKPYETFGASTIEAVSKKTGVTQAQRSSTLYYVPLPFSQFDVVINPVVLEPVVQYTYALKVRYQVKPLRPEVKTEIRYLWMTPQGGLQEVKVPK